jgi:hypothetical protein
MNRSIHPLGTDSSGTQQARFESSTQKRPAIRSGVHSGKKSRTGGSGRQVISIFDLAEPGNHIQAVKGWLPFNVAKGKPMDDVFGRLEAGIAGKEARA